MRSLSLLFLLVGCADLPNEAGPDGSDARLLAYPVKQSATQDFLDLAEIAPGVVPCANVGASQWTESGCYNLQLPPQPSIVRSYVTAHASEGPTNTNVVPFGQEQSQWVGGQTVQLGTRSSVDGRLQLISYHHEPVLGMVYPENLTRGWQTQLGARVQPSGATVTVRPWMLMSDDSIFGAAELTQSGNYPHYPWSGGSDLCSRGEESEPYACQARASATHPFIDGTCWDISMMTAFTRSGESEFRSNRLTVFAAHADVIPTPDDDITATGTLDRRVVLYPTAGVERFGEGLVDGRRRLPPWSDFEAQAAFAAHGGSSSNPWVAARDMASNECAGFDSSEVGMPRWCWFFADQQTSGAVQSPDELQSSTFVPIELSTTADGKVLVGHDARGSAGVGVFYAHTDNACDASGWRVAKPLSRAATDPDVHGTYGFAEHPMLMPDGTAPPAGRAIAGAYPWIDRSGANVFIGGHVHPRGWRECGGPAVQGSDCTAGLVTDASHKNAKAPKVWGLWTRGKIVYLDGVLEGTDYTRRADGVDQLPFYLSLFDDADWVPVRPGNNTDFFSLEHLFNHYDALVPITPGDVVWTVTAGKNHVNGEVVFDDYLMEGGLVVAPMNARLKGVPSSSDAGAPLAFRRENGMSIDPAQPSDPTYEAFTGNGLFLQNNAPLPLETLPILELRGGAFIPPVSTGVVGRGVYLDGLNDRIEVGNLSHVRDFYLGAWVEPQDGNERTLFELFDGARVNVSGSAVHLRLDDGYASGSCSQGNTTVSWTGLSLPVNTWHHVALAVEQRTGQTRVRLYVDGTDLGVRTVNTTTHWMSRSFVLGTNDSWCADGVTYAPVKGWVDELKLFELSPGAFDSDYLEEVACNRALGSLGAFGTCEQIDFRTSETLDANGVGSGLEFAKTAYDDVSCGSDTHRNGDPDCLREDRLGLVELDPDLPRPDHSGNGFCLECHQSGYPQGLGDEWTRFDLSTAALTTGAMPMHDDPRRQPSQALAIHDFDLFNGVETVLHEDAARNEYCDGVDNDGDGTRDRGCGLCPAPQVEVGRVAFESGRMPLFRQPDGTWNPRAVSTIATGGAGEAANYCGVQFALPGTAMAVLPMNGDLKPFVDASYRLLPSVGTEEYVCCGSPSASPPSPRVALEASITPIRFDDANTTMSVSCNAASATGSGIDWNRTLYCDAGAVSVSCTGEHPELWIAVGDQAPREFGSCTSTSCSATTTVGDTRAAIECRYDQYHPPLRDGLF
ncbi:MAG: hypothetical protein EP330_00140 [Deltaproteobacteria bacterium]|nr:MAG: hypothetical protein EP330_00140 [Deltaproteobacteria bacterium]